MSAEVRRVACSVSTLEADIAAALDADDEAQLRAIASTTDWPAEDPASANRILQRIALYGHSGRTERYLDVVEQLVASGVAPNLASCALLQANELAERLLADSPSTVFDIDEDGATPLHHAAERGNAPLAARLCELGAPVDAVDGRGETPLARALHAGPWKTEPAHAVIRVLRDHGASLDLVTLAAMGDTDGLIEALDAGSSVDETDQRGRTPLFVAARNNHREAVQALLARGADPNVPAADGQTPLSSACLHTLSQECDTEIVRLLVRHGAPITLEAAIVLEDLDALRRFVADAPALLDGQHHESPLGYAIHAWRPASLSCLIQSGAKPNADNWGHIERIAGTSTTLVSELKAISRQKEKPDDL